MSSIASRRVSEFCNLFVSVVKRNPTGCEALKITVFILQRNSSNSIKQCITHAQTMYYKKTLRLMIGCLFVENDINALRCYSLKIKIAELLLR